MSVIHHWTKIRFLHNANTLTREVKNVAQTHCIQTKRSNAMKNYHLYYRGDRELQPTLICRKLNYDDYTINHLATIHLVIGQSMFT